MTPCCLHWSRLGLGGVHRSKLDTGIDMGLLLGLIVGFWFGWMLMRYRVWPWSEETDTECQQQLARVRAEIHNMEQTLG